MNSAWTAAASAWSSLEVAKLLVQLILPLTIFGLGVIFDRRAKSLEQMIWKTQKNVEWKQALFDRTIGNLNKIFCAFNYIGDWRNTSPAEILQTKRALDTAIFGYRMLLTQETMDAYNRLMSVAFETSRGRGQHIRIKANVEMYKHELKNWEDAYAEMFVQKENRTRREQFNQAYDQLMTSYFRDVGLSPSA